MDTEKLTRLAVVALAGAVAGIVLYHIIAAVTRKAKQKAYTPRKMGKLIRFPLARPKGVGGVH